MPITQRCDSTADVTAADDGKSLMQYGTQLSTLSTLMRYEVS